MLSGMVVPIPLFPEWARRVLEHLPFAGMIDVPFRVYLGHIAPGDAVPAILRQLLRGRRLGEPEWVTLRLAGQLELDHQSLVTTIADRAHLTEPDRIVDGLTERGLLRGGRLTSEGRDLVDAVQAVVSDATAVIWRDLSPDDVAAAERVLHEVVRRSRLVLAEQRA